MTNPSLQLVSIIDIFVKWAIWQVFVTPNTKFFIFDQPYNVFSIEIFRNSFIFHTAGIVLRRPPYWPLCYCLQKGTYNTSLKQPATAWHGVPTHEYYHRRCLTFWLVHNGIPPAKSRSRKNGEWRGRIYTSARKPEAVFSGVYIRRRALQRLKKNGTPVPTLPGTWHDRVSAGTGWPGVSML